jgi:hypothetical protein
MILKGFKEKSNKKYLNKLLLERQINVSDSHINSLGVILNIDEIDDFELFNSLAELLKVKSNKLKIIAFSQSEKDDLNTWDKCFNPKDFGWKGTIKHPELQEFLKHKFDVLVSYYTIDIVELKLITAKSNAKFKVGILQSDERINDLIIKTNLKEFDLFKSETFKYLKILNKIKDE